MNQDHSEKVRGQGQAREQPRARRWRGGLAALMGLALLGAEARTGGFLGSRVPEPTAPPTWEEPGELIPVEGTGWTPVVAMLENSEARVRRAWHNLATAQLLLTHARIRRYPRGEPFFEIRDRVVFLENERNSAEAQFLELTERTRREGMPAGTLSPFMDFSDEIERDRKTRAASVAGTPEP